MGAGEDQHHHQPLAVGTGSVGQWEADAVTAAVVGVFVQKKPKKIVAHYPWDHHRLAELQEEALLPLV